MVLKEDMLEWISETSNPMKLNGHLHIMWSVIVAVECSTRNASARSKLLGVLIGRNQSLY